MIPDYERKRGHGECTQKKINESRVSRASVSGFAAAIGLQSQHRARCDLVTLASGLSVVRTPSGAWTGVYRM